MKFPHQYKPSESPTWRARKAIPADIRHAFGGLAMFEASTGQSDPRQAAIVTSGLVADWTARIEAARKATATGTRDDLAKLADEFRAHRGKPLDAFGAALVLEILDFAMTRIGGVSRPAMNAAMHGGGTPEKVYSVAGAKAGAVESAVNQALGLATPFSTYLPAWLSSLTNRKGGSGNAKTLDQRVASIKDFAASVPVSIEALSGKHVQTWLDEMTNKRTGQPTDAGTKLRKLSDIRPYWHWLQAHDHVSIDSNPFDKRVTSNGFTDVEAEERERLAFPAADVPKLWETAMAEGDIVLADVIRLAAYSGMRLGEVMNLTGKSIVSDGGVSSISITGARRKTRAAKRVFPIHSAVAGIIARLVDAAGDGYLIPSDAGKREAAMSKRFGRMKSRMKYGEQHVFHSIRHTVIELFRNAGVALEVRNRIVGHEDSDEKTNTGTSYGGMAGLSKQEIMERVLVYPAV